MSTAALSHARDDEPPEYPGELVLARASDAKVWFIIERMITKSWRRGKETSALAEQWKCSESLVEQYAAQAARFLRFIGETELVRAKVLARLTEIGDENEGDRVPALLGAAKVAGVLDAKPQQSTQQSSPADILSAAESALDDPPPELVELLERKWGKRTVMP